MTDRGITALAAIDRLQQRILSYETDAAIVALSGGVDSSVVLALSARTLGSAAVLAVTALSPSLPAGELDQARSVATGLGVRHRVIETREVEMEAYARNDLLRCFHCKAHLYGALSQLMSRDAGPRAVLLAGANADDAHDYRPGLLAARHARVKNPLLEEGIGKPMVRMIATHLSLGVADKPAMACLASRVAYSLPITPELLHRIDLAEQAVRALGFSAVRVRHLGDDAVIEVPISDITRLLGHPSFAGATERIGELGWRRVSVDPEGLRSGSLNRAIRPAPALRRALSQPAPSFGGVSLPGR
jgi:uncharacterized protein